MSDEGSTAWDRIYSSQGRRAEYPDEFVIRFVNRYLLDESHDPDATRVLDLGCGPGRHVAYLAREGFDTYGVDYSAVAVDMARTLCEREGLDATVKRESIFELPFDDGTFDCVIDCATIQHNRVGDIETAIAEVSRVLEPDGLFFWKTRSRADSFYGEGREVEPGTCVFHQESVVTDRDGETVEKPTHFFEHAEIRELLDERFEETAIEYTERTFDEMEEKIAHYVVVANK